MKKSAKRLLAAIVSAAMICMPMSVFAAGGNVASVDGTEYPTLQEAINNANGKTVTLLSNTTESVTIPEGTTIELDLGTFTLTNEDAKDTITNNGNLTVVGTGTVDNVSHQKTALLNNGVAMLSSGTFNRSKEAGTGADASGNNSYYTIVNHGTMTIQEGTTVMQNGKFSSLLENGWYNGNQNTSKKDSVLIIEGGHFTGGLNTIKNDDYGKLTIQGGLFENVAQAALLNWNSAEIEGGTFKVDSSSNSVVLNGYADASMDKGSLKVSGGTFSGTAVALSTMGGSQNSGTIELTGGTFEGDVVLRGTTYGGSLTISEKAVINGDVSNTKLDNITISGGSVEGTVSSTGTGTLAVNGGNFTVLPDSKYLSSVSTVAKYTSSNVATYIIGTAEEVAIQLASAVSGDEIDILQGNVSFSASEGVSVTNSGEGTVTVNNEVVEKDSTVVTPHVHQNVIHVEAKAPTATQTGNIEYWYCKDCGKYFSDTALTKEITKEQTVLSATGEGTAESTDPDGETTSDNENSPQTNDATNLAVWAVLTVLAGASIVKAALYVKHAK